MSGGVGRSMGGGVALSLARLLTGIVRVKLVALALGAAGVGIYSVILQTYLTAIAITTMSLAIPIINLGRPKIVADDYSETGAIAGTALTMVIVNWVILAISGSLLGAALLARIGVPAELGLPLWPIIIAVLFGSLSSGFCEGLAFLFNRFDIYVRVGMALAVAELVFIGAGAWLGGIHGAIYAMPAGPFIGLAAYLLMLRRDSHASPLAARLVARLSQVRRLATYSVLMFSTVALTNIGLTTLRSRVLVEAGASANGYLQTVTAISAYILSFVMTGFWGHIHARAAASGDTVEMRQELDGTLKLGLLIAFTGCGVAAVLANVLIPLFYSGEFRAAAPMMVGYMPGELCFQLFSMLVAYQLTVNRRRVYLALNVGYIGLLVGAGLMLIPSMAGFGYVAAHNLAAFTMLAAAGLLAWRSGQISTRLAAFAAALIGMLLAICLAIYFIRAGTELPPLWAAIALIPFLFSGVEVLRQIPYSTGKSPEPDFPAGSQP